MAFCKFEAEIDAKGYMTAPLEKGPMPRWHKKLKDSRKLTPLSPLNIGPGCDSRPSGKTPAKSSSSKSKTPKSNKTKGSSAALSNYDRFIPNRALMDVEKSHHLLVKIENVNEDEEDKNLSDVEFEERMNANLGVTDARILTVSHKAPQAKEGHLNANKVLYSHNKQKSATKWKSARHIPSAPERILDAPDILDDYCGLFFHTTEQLQLVLRNDHLNKTGRNSKTN